MLYYLKQVTLYPATITLKAGKSIAGSDMNCKARA
jgi:hypothetical protein